MTARQEYDALRAKLASVKVGAPMFALTPAERQRYHELDRRFGRAERDRKLERQINGRQS